MFCTRFDRVISSNFRSDLFDNTTSSRFDNFHSAGLLLFNTALNAGSTATVSTPEKERHVYIPGGLQSSTELSRYATETRS